MQYVYAVSDFIIMYMFYLKDTEILTMIKNIPIILRYRAFITTKIY
jgi:hypothetical protein